MNCLSQVGSTVCPFRPLRLERESVRLCSDDKNAARCTPRSGSIFVCLFHFRLSFGMNPPQGPMGQNREEEKSGKEPSHSVEEDHAILQH